MKIINQIGCDLIEIARIEALYKRQGDAFLKRLFTEKEQQVAKEKGAVFISHLAGRFAAKEAIAKALGSGFGEHLAFCDIEILPDSLGRPICHLSEKAKAHFGSPSISLSISHSETMAMAVAITC